MTPGPFFSFWAVGMVFGVTLYGLSAVAVLLLLYCHAVLGRRTVTWALALFVGGAFAFIVPAHIAVALLVYAGIGSIWFDPGRAVGKGGEAAAEMVAGTLGLSADSIGGLLLDTADPGLLATGHSLGAGSGY